MRIDLNKNKIDSVSFLEYFDKLEKLEFLDIADNNLPNLTYTEKTHLTLVCCRGNRFALETNSIYKNIRGKVISIKETLDENKCLKCPINSLEKHHGGYTIWCLQFDPESKTLFSGGGDGSIKVIKFKDNQLKTFDLVLSLDKHHGSSCILCLQFDPE